MKNQLNDYYKALIAGGKLDSQGAKIIMQGITSGKVSPIKIAALLTILHIKGETFEEIHGFAEVLRERPVKVSKSFNEEIIDTCGTGGDNKNTFNISTISALMLAAAGAKVSKHGNRSITSKCGSADLLEKLGVKIHLSPKQITDCLSEVGIAFLFAPALHPVMKYIMPVRKELGFRTIFNLLGPLLNPVMPECQIMGVYDARYLLPIAKALMRLGVSRGMVVSGEDGLDEISLSTKTKIAEFNENGQIKEYELHPEKLGFKRCKIKELVSYSTEDSARMALTILKGEEQGSKRDIVILNAAAGLKLYKKMTSFAEAVHEIKQILKSGLAYQTLKNLIAFSNR